MYKAIFWDNDGVLVDTEILFFKATRTVFKIQGFDLSILDFINYFLIQGKGTWFWLEEKGANESDIIALKKYRDELYCSLISTENFIIPQVENTLALMSQHVKNIVVTSSLQMHFSAIHERTGYNKYFQHVITANDCIKTKPDPEPYLKALALTQLEKKECLVIEDSLRGLIAAKAAGLDCWIIPNTFTKSSDFSSAEKVLYSITDIPKLFGVATTVV